MQTSLIVRIVFMSERLIEFFLVKRVQDSKLTINIHRQIKKMEKKIKSNITNPTLYIPVKCTMQQAVNGNGVKVAVTKRDDKASTCLHCCLSSVLRCESVPNVKV